MSATNASSVSSELLRIPYQLNIYIGLFIFVTGNISNFGNLLVFTSRLFRARACSLYLIGDCACNVIYFNYVLVTRMIQKGFQLPIINRYDPICKIRQFFSEYTHQVAFTLFTLATLDRYLSTHRSMAFRRWSNRRPLACKLIVASVLVWFALIAHRLFLYSNARGTCAPQPGVYEKFDSYFEVAFSGIAPPITLIILGCLLLHNVRDVARRRIAPTGVAAAAAANQPSPSYIHQIDMQLSTMLFLQSFMAIPSFVPFGAQNLYTSITRDWYKSPLRLAWEDVIIETIRLASYLFYSTSFYVSFCSSRGFRKQVYYSLGLKRRKQPTNQTTTHGQ